MAMDTIRLRYIAKCIRVQDKRRKRQGLNVEEQSGSYFRKQDDILC